MSRGFSLVSVKPVTPSASRGVGIFRAKTSTCGFIPALGESTKFLLIAVDQCLFLRQRPRLYSLLCLNRLRRIGELIKEYDLDRTA